MNLRLSEEAIQGFVRKIADEIINNETERPDIVVPIMNGAMFFAADLLRFLYPTINPQVAPIKFIKSPSVARPGVFTVSGRINDIDVVGSVQNKRVLLVDVISNSGQTLRQARSLIQERYARSVLCAVLLWRNLPEAAVGKPTYVGLDLNGDTSILSGYGLVKDGVHRGARNIYVH